MRTTAIIMHSSGFLVPEFLESQMSGPEFLMSLSESSSEFADFLMVTVDVGQVPDKVAAMSALELL